MSEWTLSVSLSACAVFVYVGSAVETRKGLAELECKSEAVRRGISRKLYCCLDDAERHNQYQYFPLQSPV